MFKAFYDLIYSVLFSNGDTVLNDLSYTVGGEFSDTPVLPFDAYLSELMALICTIIVYVIVCLCIYKVIKLIGRLFVRL